MARPDGKINRTLPAARSIAPVPPSLKDNPARRIADNWIIDLGPEGGDGGGRIVAAGTPEDVAKVRASHTGR